MNGNRVIRETKVLPENIAEDLALLGENTATGEYGYAVDDDGSLLVEVWNDNFHGVKQTYRLDLILIPA